MARFTSFVKKKNLNNLNILNLITKIKLLTCYAYVFCKPILTASTFFVPNRSRMKTILIFFYINQAHVSFLASKWSWHKWLCDHLPLRPWVSVLLRNVSNARTSKARLWQFGQDFDWHRSWTHKHTWIKRKRRSRR